MKNIIIIDDYIKTFACQSFLDELLSNYDPSDTKIIYLRWDSQTKWDKINEIAKEYQISEFVFRQVFDNFDIYYDALVTNYEYMYQGLPEEKMRAEYQTMIASAKNVITVNWHAMQYLKFTNAKRICYLPEQKKVRASNISEFSQMNVHNIYHQFLVDEYICENEATKSYIKSIVDHVNDNDIKLITKGEVWKQS